MLKFQHRVNLIWNCPCRIGPWSFNSRTEFDLLPGTTSSSSVSVNPTGRKCNKTFSTFCQTAKVLDMCQAHSQEELTHPFKTNIYKNRPKSHDIKNTLCGTKDPTAVISFKSLYKHFFGGKVLSRQKSIISVGAKTSANKGDCLGVKLARNKSVHVALYKIALYVS